MAYTYLNFQTKKALKERVKEHAEKGHPGVRVQPGFLGHDDKDGEVTIEGPHAPKPHRWYARVLVKDGRIVRVLS